MPSYYNFGFFGENLSKLIKAKAEFEQTKFTHRKLALALNIPPSVISRITNSQSAAKVDNPRLETLVKIVDYFIDSGFPITLEKMLTKPDILIDIRKSVEPVFYTNVILPLYDKNYKLIDKKFETNLNSKVKIKNLIALRHPYTVSKKNYPNALFIIDTKNEKQKGSLCLIKVHNKEIFLIAKNKSTASEQKFINILNNEYISDTVSIIGVVIQITI